MFNQTLALAFQQLQLSLSFLNSDVKLRQFIAWNREPTDANDYLSPNLGELEWRFRSLKLLQLYAFGVGDSQSCVQCVARRLPWCAEGFVYLSECFVASCPELSGVEGLGSKVVDFHVVEM